MKQGPELLRWAEAQAVAAATSDFDLIGISGFKETTAAIANAYLLGGVEALADEIARIKREAVQGAVPHADGMAI